MDYSFLLNTKTADKWHKIGAKCRAGIAVPLFSVYSENSIGIGEIPDLKLLIDWCNKTGMTILQLLPLNDVGNDFAPYSSISTFALDPMYLSIKLLRDVDINKYIDKLKELKNKFRPLFGRVNYKIKKAKLDILWDIYINSTLNNITELNNFILNNDYWLKDYALYKVIIESLPDSRWEFWNSSVKYRNFDALNEIETENMKRINFFYWVQWQLYEQMKEIKHFAASKGVFIMGDLPFLVSRESADVWAHKNYFRLDLSAGAPPDMYFALGQKWGMPPFDWDKIANEGFLYLKERLKYAENFYNMYRIDHFVGLFRVWTSSINDNSPTGSYLPYEEYLWETHGRRILDEMINSSSMLPCAEDLGTVPECSYKVLSEYGIPGIDFQRYMKSNFNFRSPYEYRSNSCAVLSTHDSTFFVNWWQFEAGTIDEKLFEIMFFSQSSDVQHYKYVKETLFNLQVSMNGRLRWNEFVSSVDVMFSILRPSPEKTNDFSYIYMESFGEKQKFMNFLGINNFNEDISLELVKSALVKANESCSIFSIQLLHEYLCLDPGLINKISRKNYRINVPGKVSKNNWSLILPVSIEKLLDLDINVEIKDIISLTSRV